MRRLIALAVVAAVASACGGEQPEGGAALPVPGRAVFTQGTDLWLREEDGTERLLIEAPAEHQLMQPAFSPDGRRIAYISFRLSAAAGAEIGSDLMIWDEAGGSRAVGADEAEARYTWDPRWMPDGERVWATRQRAGGASSVELIEAGTGEVLMRVEDAAGADASADGGRIAFTSSPGGADAALAVLDLGTGERMMIGSAADWGLSGPRAARWTADGERIVFAASALAETASAVPMGTAAWNGAEDIWAVAADGGGPTAVALVGEDQPAFAVSSDGAHVLVLGAYGLYLARLPGAREEADAPYAIAPGEFHGTFDWRGAVTAEEWEAIREAAAP